MQCARCNDDAVSAEGYCRWCHQDYLAALLQFAGPAMIDDEQLWQLWDNRNKEGGVTCQDDRQGST